jgi:GT2 family glycosyltransferase
MSILDGNDIPDEIVIVDQSNVAHPTLAKFQSSGQCKLHYLHSESRGLSRGKNAGIAAARNDILVFTEDDVLVTKDWFATMVQALVNVGPRNVITGQVLPVASSRKDGFVLSIKEDPNPATYSGRLSEDVLFAGNMAIYRSAFAEVGNFDIRLGAGSSFPAAEDSDLAIRLLERGYRIHYIPEAIIYHRAWRSAQDYVSLRWTYGKGQGGYYAKYFNWRDHFMIQRMYADATRHSGRVLRYGWKRSFKQNYSDIAYFLGLLHGAVAWMLTQRKTP